MDSTCIDQNSNARCFLAIEIENQTDRKHLMGSSLNSSIMGKIGIVICEGNSLDNLEKFFGYIQEMICREKLPLIMKKCDLDKKDRFSMQSSIDFLHPLSSRSILKGRYVLVF